MCTYRFEYLSHDNTFELVNTCAHASRYISVVWVCEYMYLNQSSTGIPVSRPEAYMFADTNLTTVICLNMDAGLYVLPHGILILKRTGQ